MGLDIDETIIHTKRYYGLFDRPDDAEFYFSLWDGDYEETYALYCRAYLNEFIKLLDNNFKIFFYTRADKKYAEIILKHLKLDKYPLFGREHTIVHDEIVFNAYRGNIVLKRYQKDLSIIAAELKTDIKNIVFIDDDNNSNQLVQPEITIKIPEFVNDIQDFDLKIIGDHIEKGLKYNKEDLRDYILSLKFL